MNSPADFDNARPVPLRFRSASREALKLAALPSKPPTQADLAAELEAALLRDLSLVSAAFPQSARTGAERPTPERPAPRVVPSDEAAETAPEPKPASGPVPPGATTEPAHRKRVDGPAVPRRSPYAPPASKGQHTSVRPRQPPPPESPPAIEHPRSDPHVGESEPLDWLDELPLEDEEDASPARGSRPARATLAVAVLLASVVGGGLLLAFRPSITPDPIRGRPEAVLSASMLGAPAAIRPPAAAPPPAAPQAPVPDPAEPGPPMVIVPLAGAEAEAGVALAAVQAAAMANAPVASEPGHVADLDHRTGPAAYSVPIVEQPAPEPELRVTRVEPEVVAPSRAVPAAVGTPQPGPARTTTDVNMRSGPDNGAPTVRVLARGSAVTVLRCDYWCEIDAAGSRGWVFKRFLRPG